MVVVVDLDLDDEVVPLARTRAQDMGLTFNQLANLALLQHLSESGGEAATAWGAGTSKDSIPPGIRDWPEISAEVLCCEQALAAR